MAGDQHRKRDIILETRNSSIQKVADTHRSYDALQYHRMFWQREDEYHCQLRQRNPSTGAFTVRKSERLRYIQCNQKKLRVEEYIHLRDTVVSEGQKLQNCHDLLARVFHRTPNILMNLITQGKIFGIVQCYMFTIEWQKQGLSHAHILVWFQESLQVHKVYDFISAEIPNPEEDQELFSAALQHK
ncbi:helitron_like_N domain-containing protein [Trichonephila clavipes]|nr:helitron_like_N domain-containing protein [Trichonephila clavipes]